jgi:ADP-ribose pyrophosphatase
MTSSSTAESHLKEERTASEVLVKGNFLQVCRDTVRLPDGHTPRANT